jgi:hypothetical protein
MSEFVGKCLIAALIVFVCCLIGAWPIQLLWNDLMPTIFKLPTITFWQALKLDVLATCLFYQSSGSRSSDE